jgi:hypothetical protein
VAGLDPWAFSPRTRSVGTHVFVTDIVAGQDVDARNRPGQGAFGDNLGGKTTTREVREA